MIRISATLALLSLSSGCSSAGSVFGLVPNRSPEDKTAKALRRDGPVALPHELNKATLESYILEPGDGLLILPSDLDSPAKVPSDHTILIDGTIDLGRYGRVSVAGRSLAEVETLVQEAIAAKTKDAGFIDVRLINRQSKAFYVLGEVRTPGSFPLAGRETVLDAIVVAGGLSESASRNNISLVRPCATGPGEILGVDYTAITQLGDATTNYQLRPGDRIYIPSKSLKETLFGSARR